MWFDVVVVLVIVQVEVLVDRIDRVDRVGRGYNQVIDARLVKVWLNDSRMVVVGSNIVEIKEVEVIDARR